MIDAFERLHKGMARITDWVCLVLIPAGNSVCARVHGFLPYFYVEAPPGFSVDEIAPFKTSLAVGASSGGVQGAAADADACIAQLCCHCSKLAAFRRV